MLTETILLGGKNKKQEKNMLSIYYISTFQNFMGKSEFTKLLYNYKYSDDKDAITTV